MKLHHWMRRENSGLAHTTMELMEEEQRQGHQIRIQEPSVDQPLLSEFQGPADVHAIHSQFGPTGWHEHGAKVMWMHGEPLGSVGNGISMRAIVDLAPQMDAFICMRTEEQPIWNAIRRTYVVNKGIDLERFKPVAPVAPVEKLSGAPAVLYCENWRGQRNPLIPCLAMQEVHRVLPEARLHLYNCPGGKMAETFTALIEHCRWQLFLRTIKGPEADIVGLLNRCDILVSGLSPLYARGIEAFGCGKAFIGPGYKEPGYPYTCDLEVHSMAAAILKCWSEYGKFDFRQWAVSRHNVSDTVKQSMEVYARYG